MLTKEKCWEPAKHVGSNENSHLRDDLFIFRTRWLLRVTKHFYNKRIAHGHTKKSWQVE